MIDNLLLILSNLAAYLRQSLDWIALAPIDQFIRVFWAVIFIDIPRYLLPNLYVLLLYLREQRNEATADAAMVVEDHRLVSVVVPALNEEETIASTVQSLLEQDYPNIEVIVVDDGSTDGTAAVCRNLQLGARVHFLRTEERQGKSAALNFGIASSRGDYIVCMDSDSTLDRDCISTLVYHLRDESVGAVGGNLDVRNFDVNLLTWLQAIEYLISISVDRRFKSELGILSIVPGAIGIFRRDLLERIGHLEPGPGNDSDLTIRLRKLHRKILFAYDAVCRTNVPTTVSSLVRQRLRWDRNIIRNRLRKHRDIMNPFSENFEIASFVSFIDVFFFVGFLPLAWVVYFIDMLISYPGDLLLIFMVVMIIHLFLNVIRLSVSIYVTRNEYSMAMLYLCLPVYVLYRIGLKIVRVTAIVQELFFRASYRDPFAPAKVRKEMEIY